MRSGDGPTTLRNSFARARYGEVASETPEARHCSHLASSWLAKFRLGQLEPGGDLYEPLSTIVCWNLLLPTGGLPRMACQQSQSTWPAVGISRHVRWKVGPSGPRVITVVLAVRVRLLRSGLPST
jgi:hypothetical protein